MLNSKQRAFLRGLANRIDTILIVGKGEITDNIIKQADDATAGAGGNTKPEALRDHRCHEVRYRTAILCPSSPAALF